MGRQTKTWTPFENSGSTKYTYSEIVYDDAGKILEKKKHIGKVDKGVTPTLNFVSDHFQYYSNGLVKAVLDNANGYMGFEYDADGNIAKEINVNFQIKTDEFLKINSPTNTLKSA